MFPAGASVEKRHALCAEGPRRPQPDELRRLNLEQDSSGASMRPWIVAAIAAIVVVMLVYGYTVPISTTAGAPPSGSAPTTTGAAPAPPPIGNPLAATPDNR